MNISNKRELTSNLLKSVNALAEAVLLAKGIEKSKIS